MIDAIFVPPTVHYGIGTAVLLLSIALALSTIGLQVRKLPMNRWVSVLGVLFQIALMLQALLGIKLLDQGLGVLQLYIHYLGGLAPLLFFLVLYWVPPRSESRRVLWQMVASIAAVAFVALTYFVGGQFARRNTLAAAANSTIVGVPTLTAGGAPITLELSTQADAMRFDKDRLEAPAGARVTLRFTNGASANGMVHNAVVVIPGQADAVGRDAIGSNDPATWLKPNDPRVIAATRLIKGGESASVTFDVTAPGDYTIICTFPGHHTQMQIPLRVR